MAEKFSDIPAEDLRVFIRDVAVRAFDQLASRYSDDDNPDFERSRRGAAVARLARLWQEMDSSEKTAFFDHVINVAAAAAIVTPAVIGIRKAVKKRTAAWPKRNAAESPSASKRPKKKK